MIKLRSELHSFRLELRKPLITGAVSVRYRAGLLVALSDGEHIGWGEASPLPGWSRTTMAKTSEGLHFALGQIDTQGSAAIPEVLESLAQRPHARAAVSGAWSDLQARRAGQSLAAHLLAQIGFGAQRDHGSHLPSLASVAVNALVTATDPEEVSQQSDAARQAGFKALKLKVAATDPATDVERVRAARQSLGSGPELRLDANGGWDHNTAVDVLNRVEPYGIAFCEEPVSGLTGIAAVGRSVGVPVAADESISSLESAKAALHLGVSTLIVKPQAFGGPDKSLAVALQAKDAAANLVITSFVDSAIGVAHAFHVAVAVDTMTELFGGIAESSQFARSSGSMAESSQFARSSGGIAESSGSIAESSGSMAELAQSNVEPVAAESRQSSGHAQAHGLATSNMLANDLAEPPSIMNGRMTMHRTAGLGITPNKTNLGREES